MKVFEYKLRAKQGIDSSKSQLGLEYNEKFGGKKLLEMKKNLRYSKVGLLCAQTFIKKAVMIQ